MQFPILKSTTRWHSYDVLPNIIKSQLPLMALDVETMNTELGNEAVSVCMVDQSLYQVFNALMRPRGKHIRFSGTHIHGISTSQLRYTCDRDFTLDELYQMLPGKVIIAHSIEGDLKAIEYNSGVDCYDISKCPYIRDGLRLKGMMGAWDERKVSLKRMASSLLGLEIQGVYHTAAEDAKATMQLFQWAARDVHHTGVEDVMRSLCVCSL
jgi:DNA polymerase III alpha subunit (gram-positive type)